MMRGWKIKHSEITGIAIDDNGNKVGYFHQGHKGYYMPESAFFETEDDAEVIRQKYTDHFPDGRYDMCGGICGGFNYKLCENCFRFMEHLEQLEDIPDNCPYYLEQVVG